MAHISKDPTYDSKERLSAGSVSGLSSIMKRSDDNSYQDNKLIDINLPDRNFKEI